MNKTFYVYCLVALFAVGCQPIATSYSTPVLETQVSNNGITETPIIPTSEPSPTTPPEIVFNKISTANNSETKLNNQCLNVTNGPPTSNSIIVLRSLQDVVAHQAPDIILVDMSDGQLKETIQKTQITPNFAVSANGKLIAYEASTIKDGEVTQLDLIIANGNFQTQNSIPWDDQWDSILGWTTDQKVIISSSTLESASKPPVSYVLVDPLNGRQQAIHLRISDFLDKSLYDLPYWGGWYGLLIDPTLKLAVYPRQSNVNKEMYTYALWDLASNETVFSLENIFSAFSNFNDTFPVPSWSTDGTQFAFVGEKEEVVPTKFELFLVNREGDIEQLTNLSDIAYVWPSSHSWPSDNNHIAFFLSPPQEAVNGNANVAILNANTLEVTDLCLSVNFQDFAPIWSPNGKQFLIVDSYEKDHQRVLLIDVEKNVVFPIAEDVEPIGWMIKP